MSDLHLKILDILALLQGRSVQLFAKELMVKI